MRAARRPRFGRLVTPAGPQREPWIAHGTMCSIRQKDGAAPAGRLVGAKAVVRVDVVPAPAARLAVQQIRCRKGSPVEAREQAIVETAKQQPADGYHVVTALVRGSLSNGVKLVAKG